MPAHTNPAQVAPVDVPEPVPGPQLEPAPETTTRKPVVLATSLLQELVIPVEDGDDIHVTPAGVALTKSQAQLVEAAAHATGVRLIDLTPAKD